MNRYDAVVVGGGHAGVEASHALATLGFKTALFSLNKKMIANMPCNPSIGGSAKGIVVREIDALGGIMGKCADRDYLQIKMLNMSKGPGVRCLRAQEDKYNYPHIVQEELMNTPNLDIIEEMVDSLLVEDGVIKGVKVKNKTYYADAVILTTGTYMESTISVGFKKIPAGPDGEKASHGLSKSLQDLGIEIYRLKTGTPPRILKSSIDYSKAEIQLGSLGEYAFSYETNEYKTIDEQLPCYLIYTTQETHDIIRNNLDHSSQFNGTIQSLGPRYCPSIEGKVMTFATKERHQLFLEPETRDGESIYLQGFSTSMDEEIQEKMVHSLLGLENAKILKYAYAIEYDAIKTTEYDASLGIKKVKGLFIGGQICGTSGYEEAAGLGLIAGINAARYLKKEPPFILKRNEAYIGVMIDDLITKGSEEPYRLMSSRAEYRLLLRHDNADLRLTEYGHELGLISEERYIEFIKNKNNIEEILAMLKDTKVGGTKLVNEILNEKGYNPLLSGVSLDELLKRPNIDFEDIVKIEPRLAEYKLNKNSILQIETIVKYEGYIKNQLKDAKNLEKMENIILPKDIDYLNFEGLALEARQKLNKVRPLTLGQAYRVAGVDPSDINVLILTLKKNKQL